MNRIAPDIAMSAACPFIIDDSDDDDGYNTNNGDVELLEYDSEDSEPEVISVQTHTRPSVSSGTSHNNPSIKLPDVEIPHARLSNGPVVRPGDTLELLDHSTHAPSSMHSGDFFMIRTIIQNLETDVIRFRGHRMRRTKYLGQIWDWKLNELCMVLHIEEGDHRCPFVAGLEEVAMGEIVGTRPCALTNKPYPLLSFRDGWRCAHPVGTSKEEIRRQVYHEGRLTCRVVIILFMHKKAMKTKSTQKARGGIVRSLYAHETRTSGTSAFEVSRTPDTGDSRETSIVVEDDDDDDVVIVSSGKRRARSDSVEILEQRLPKHPLRYPAKKGRYTIGDVFCGFGGASQGAAQAGLHVAWGLDVDQQALRAYKMNHPGASGFLCNAHDFPPPGKTKEELRVHVLHLSPPCCFFSPAHTVEGPNDQANYEAIYTIGPILQKVGPRVATLEQTFGLASDGRHLKNFYMLLNDIGKAGYDVRYKIQDLSKHGLAQRRKRLLIIAARRGTPLPHFPKESHGPSGSGLQPFVYVDKVLQTLERMGPRALEERYHMPKQARQPREPTDAHGFLRGCITTGGSPSYHYSGLRRWTVRELSLLQSFPYGYKFTGSQTEATKQVGNAFPPVMAEAMYRTIVKTLEAFDEGLIGAEEDIQDLDALLLTRRGASTVSRLQPQTPSHSPLSPAPRPTFPYGESHSVARSSALSPRASTNANVSSRAGAQLPASSTSWWEGRGDGIGPRTNSHVRPGKRMPMSGADQLSEAIELSD
ncbi:hypothetical protein LEMA_P040230.1 [Plenodomus lingam JN3]|uniref:DNA (cytosine-5-)-methyltransferase n=1 Tax=Leptosphaeria maculans (strain JN3 / isolate v23.1.3 / race Av1-4-5-6-7-8) TaxID=985895 RepID=E4ZP97_LEPMJ|nr:hypothetical protein LEMA_P040230.1 [Plenodomus lingam JN3]CBX93122.1 hypothetical protein LEMA_P040230.1 [Plenodomus lingam JN3]